ncbi:HEPN domain-containing protein [Nevskia ramosa]|uniref:HEPN domain-containing protein n=1 Tax=Nevskia ramosa TaxID=64002 RepID=UPI00235416FF|nr:HEPN domain-containing protein [Nevskia ramosa]
MQTMYHFPALFLIPDFDEPVVCGKYSLVRRRWDTSIFDLATLATKHKIHLPYQLMDVLLGACNCEIAVTEASSPSEAIELFQYLRVGLYVAGVSPFIAPFLATESINNYSGINERDSALERGATPKIPSDFSTSTGQMEAWPYELTHQCAALPERLQISVTQFQEAVVFADRWQAATKISPSLNAVVGAVTSAPRLGSLPQAILHVWTAIESLLPSVNTEVSFRIALYLTALCETSPNRSAFHKHAKSAYSVRSKIAHGSSPGVGLPEWEAAWQLVLSVAKAIAERGKLPTEEQLLIEVLDG